MIYLLVTRRHRYTLKPFFTHWDRGLERLVRVVPYDLIRSVHYRPGSVFVFTDLDRLSPPMRETALRFSRMMLQRGGGNRLVNDPRHVLSRLQLLQALDERGSNAFRAHPAAIAPAGMRFPVFLRFANDHAGPRTGLLRDGAAYAHALAALAPTVPPGEALIAIEFCDTAGTDGCYRKYSCFRIGEAIIPAHLLVASEWMVKDSPPEALRGEEREFIDNNPHRDEVRRIFDLAGIGYGRIDYALQDGRLQTWEINTNPVLIREQSAYAPDKLPLRRRLAQQISAAFAGLDSGSVPEPAPVPALGPTP